MSTITAEQTQAITDHLAKCKLVHGIGTKDEMCSLAAINMGLFGRLDDVIRPCMSLGIGRWIVRVQDEMPLDMLNSAEWRALLPLAAGTGRKHEKEVAAVALDWMWARVSPQVQSGAHKGGFGDEWRKMCVDKTEKSASAAAAAYAVAADTAADADGADFWVKSDPITCLRDMILATGVAV